MFFFFLFTFLRKRLFVILCNLYFLFFFKRLLWRILLNVCLKVRYIVIIELFWIVKLIIVKEKRKRKINIYVNWFSEICWFLIVEKCFLNWLKELNISYLKFFNLVISTGELISLYWELKMFRNFYFLYGEGSYIFIFLF